MQLSRMLLIEIIAIFIPSFILGILVGGFISQLILNYMLGEFTEPGFRVLIPWFKFSIVTIVLILSGLISSMIPVYKLSSKPTGTILKAE